MTFSLRRVLVVVLSYFFSIAVPQAVIVAIGIWQDSAALYPLSFASISNELGGLILWNMFWLAPLPLVIVHAELNHRRGWLRYAIAGLIGVIPLAFLQAGISASEGGPFLRVFLMTLFAATCVSLVTTTLYWLIAGRRAGF